MIGSGSTRAKQSGNQKRSPNLCSAQRCCCCKKQQQREPVVVVVVVKNNNNGQ